MYILCSLGLIPHSAIPSSSRGPATCSTFIKPGKDTFSSPSLLPELAGPEPPLNEEQAMAVAQVICAHARCISSAIALCPRDFCMGAGKSTGPSVQVCEEIPKIKGCGWLNPALPYHHPIHGSAAPGVALSGWLCCLLPISLLVVLSLLP